MNQVAEKGKYEALCCNFLPQITARATQRSKQSCGSPILWSDGSVWLPCP